MFYDNAIEYRIEKERDSATPVCPSWIDTDLLMKEVNGRRVHQIFTVK
jgi:hypothetical protein